MRNEDEKANRRRKKMINKFEKIFAYHGYTGKGKKVLETTKGIFPVAISALRPVNFFDKEKEMAASFTGSLVKLLSIETGCHALYAEKAYNAAQRESLTAQIERYIKENDIKVLIDFYAADESFGYVSKLWTSGEDNYRFVKKLIQYAFEYEYRDKLPKEVIEYEDNRQASIASNAARKAKIFFVHIELNKKYFNPLEQDKFLHVVETLAKIFTILSRIDWEAERIEAYRLWQSIKHKPQDKVEICNVGEKDCLFKINSLLSICSYGPETEKVRLHRTEKAAENDLLQSCKKKNTSKPHEEYIFLTNRLINVIFGRKWIEKGEKSSGLMGAPIIVYESRKEEYSIGFPKVDRIDGAFFSTALFERKKEEAKNFDYMLFNRYTDSRLFIEFKKADYGDGGGVRDKNGPAEKVMLPRYYKRLLGYMDYPVSMIRSEEYDNILEKLTPGEKKSFQACYGAIRDETFYELKVKGDNVEDDVIERKHLNRVIEIEKKLGLYGKIELLKIPKETGSKERICKCVLRKLRGLQVKLLEKIIGKSEYLLKTKWTNETDDRNNIARLSPDMMRLLGVLENDKIWIKFGKKQEILRVLEDGQLADYQIGIPAFTRRELGMNSINDIVVVYRDMAHILRRHSEEQTIAILGTILAVFQVITKTWIGVLVCAIFIPLILYFVLNKERIKVK